MIDILCTMKILDKNIRINRMPWLLLAILFLGGCAAHPTISPIPLKKGEVYTGVTLSMENVLPMFVYRKGLSEKSDFGVRVGIPLYGTGIDYSRVVYSRKNAYDILNFAFSITPNSSFDMTYYTVKRLPAKPQNSYYTGFRAMIIPHGINDQRSVRVGFLMGLNFSRKVGIEIGYCHDLDRGQPIEYLFSPKVHNDPKYPAVTEYGFPTENSRLVGLSFQLSFSTKVFQKKSKTK